MTDPAWTPHQLRGAWFSGFIYGFVSGATIIAAMWLAIGTGLGDAP